MLLMNGVLPSRGSSGRIYTAVPVTGSPAVAVGIDAFQRPAPVAFGGFLLPFIMVLYLVDEPSCFVEEPQGIIRIMQGRERCNADGLAIALKQRGVGPGAYDQVVVGIQGQCLEDISPAGISVLPALHVHRVIGSIVKLDIFCQWKAYLWRFIVKDLVDDHTALYIGLFCLKIEIAVLRMNELPGAIGYRIYLQMISHALL